MKSRPSIIAFACIALIVAFGLGVQLVRRNPHSVEACISVIKHRLGFERIADASERGFADSSGRREVGCARFRGSEEGTVVLLAFGQSNSANYGATRHRSIEAVANFNFLDGRCYAASDPLLGADGEAGSVWTRVGDRLVENGHAKRVLIVPFGVGDSSIADWAPGGLLNPRIQRVAMEIAEAGLEVTHVAWHQGERDAREGTSPEAYVRSFEAMLGSLREFGIQSPVYAAIATTCLGFSSPPLRRAQASLPQHLEGVLAGPDTDLLDRFVYRSTPCHFSGPGLDAHADLWVETLTGIRRPLGRLTR